MQLGNSSQAPTPLAPQSSPKFRVCLTPRVEHRQDEDEPAPPQECSVSLNSAEPLAVQKDRLSHSEVASLLGGGGEACSAEHELLQLLFCIPSPEPALQHKCLAPAPPSPLASDSDTYSESDSDSGIDEGDCLCPDQQVMLQLLLCD